jgi:hypothetical protein
MPPRVKGVAVRRREEEREGSGAEKLRESAPVLIHSEPGEAVVAWPRRPQRRGIHVDGRR